MTVPFFVVLKFFMRSYRPLIIVLISVDYSELKKRYWGGHLWGIGYGAWSTGNITDEMIQQYLDHHKEGPNSDQNFILE